MRWKPTYEQMQVAKFTYTSGVAFFAILLTETDFAD